MWSPFRRAPDPCALAAFPVLPHHRVQQRPFRARGTGGTSDVTDLDFAEDPRVRDLMAGAAAGLVATVPMTLAMDAMHRRLPRRQRYPLPPRIIEQRLTRAAGVEPELDEPDHVGLTLAAHFGYGTAAGSLFPLISRALPGGAVAKGVQYGLLVWAGSYLGLLPATGILTPATEHPRRRNALMIAAHVVWGGTLGALAGRAPVGRAVGFDSPSAGPVTGVNRRRLR
jgi:hypothetical protein